MPIPKEILAVRRPVNTVVVAYGKNRDRYAVRKRVGCRNVGGRRLPVNGPTVGHIVGGEYVPLPEAPAVAEAEADVRAWAAFALAEEVAGDLYEDLLGFYDPRDAGKIWCISVLRVCEPGVRDCELKAAYEESPLPEARPGVALSRNTVSAFLRDVGRATSRVAGFMRARAEAVRADHTLLVDGTLKSDESRVNTLSDFSYKARAKGTRDMSVMYAFDLDEMEPVCSKCFPGNMLDYTSYGAFIEENGITRGLIVSDKGLPAAAAEQRFAANPDLHHLNPIKRNSRLISTHSMLDFEGVLPGWEGVLFKKGQREGQVALRLPRLGQGGEGGARLDGEGPEEGRLRPGEAEEEAGGPRDGRARERPGHGPRGRLPGLLGALDHRGLDALLQARARAGRDARARRLLGDRERVLRLPGLGNHVEAHRALPRRGPAREAHVRPGDEGPAPRQAGPRRHRRRVEARQNGARRHRGPPCAGPPAQARGAAQAKAGEAAQVGDGARIVPQIGKVLLKGSIGNIY